MQADIILLQMDMQHFAHGYNCYANADYSTVLGDRGNTQNIITPTNNPRMFAIGSPGSNSTTTTYNPFYVESSIDYGNDMEPKQNMFTVDKNGNMFLRGFPYNVKGVLNNRLIGSGDYFILEDGAAYILWTNTRMANNEHGEELRHITSFLHFLLSHMELERQQQLLR